MIYTAESLTPKPRTANLYLALFLMFQQSNLAREEPIHQAFGCGRKLFGKLAGKDPAPAGGRAACLPSFAQKSFNSIPLPSPDPACRCLLSWCCFLP